MSYSISVWRGDERYEFDVQDESDLKEAEGLLEYSSATITLDRPDVGVVSLENLKMIVPHPEAVFEAAYNESPDLDGALAKLKNGYLHYGGKFSAIDDALDSIGTTGQAAIWIDEDKVWTSISDDLVELADGSYVKWRQ